MNPLRYLFLDLNAYFASCEQAHNPRYRGKPLIVRPSPSEYTSAVATSYEARAFGIKNFMRVWEARERCPGLIVCDARHELYVHYHHKIIEAVESVLPVDKVYSVDEMACRLIGDEREPQEAMRLAAEVKAAVARVSPALRCSVGIAPSILLAKLATDMMKPNGLVVLEEKDLPGKIAHLALTEISGISTANEARLRDAGVNSMLDLWNLDPKHARRIWNSVVGERLWYGLHGADIRAAETERGMFTHSRILSGELRKPARARIVLRELVLKAAMRLRREAMTGKYLAIQVKLASKNRYGLEVSFAPSQDSFLLLEKSEDMWRKIMPFIGRDLVASVSIIVAGLAPLVTRIGDLFEENGSGEATQNENLWKALDHLNHKHGKGTVRLASQDKMNLAYLGAKIAFNRVPEAREFSE
jgi:DNA polymerase IV